jgi:hypothetical protein
MNGEFNMDNLVIFRGMPGNQVERVKRLFNEVLSEVQSGKITVKEGMEFCYQMRNKIMDETRVATSAQGRAKAVSMKPDGGRPLEYYLNKYSDELFKRPKS